MPGQGARGSELRTQWPERRVAPGPAVALASGVGSGARQCPRPVWWLKETTGTPPTQPGQRSETQLAHAHAHSHAWQLLPFYCGYPSSQISNLCRADDRPAEPQPDLLLGCLPLHLGMREACQCPCRTQATGSEQNEEQNVPEESSPRGGPPWEGAGALWGCRALAGSGKELRCCRKSRGDMATLPPGGPSSPWTLRWEGTGGGWFPSKEAGQEEEGLSRFWGVLASHAMVCFCPGPALRPSRPPRSHPGAGQASASFLQGRLLAGHRVPYQFLSGPGSSRHLQGRASGLLPALTAEGRPGGHGEEAPSTGHEEAAGKP